MFYLYGINSDIQDFKVYSVDIIYKMVSTGTSNNILMVQLIHKKENHCKNLSGMIIIFIEMHIFHVVI